MAMQIKLIVVVVVVASPGNVWNVCQWEKTSFCVRHRVDVSAGV